MLSDAHGRTIDYLRLAVTDRCNLRCRYCMPEEGIEFLDRKDILTFEEISRISRILSENGVRKIRITGGEPFVRKGIIDLLQEINKYYSVINITSNATLLQRHIADLKKLKIGSINISIDSLDRDRFFFITKRDVFNNVWDTIISLLEEGIRVKLNTVIMKGINDDEIFNFIKLARDYNLDVRFIEAMPFNGYDGNTDLFMSMPEILETIKGGFPDIAEVKNQEKRSASVKYTIPGFTGNIGIIPAYTRSLCGQCNRMRITARGELLTCLYSTKGVDLKQLIREGISDDDLLKTIKSAIFKKEKDGFEAEKAGKSSGAYRSMTTIGG